MIKQFRRWLEGETGFAALLGLALLTAFGLQMTRMGFYWDDWQMVYLAQTGNFRLYWEHFLSDRPFVAWIYWLVTHLVGHSPLAAHLLTLTARWVSVLGFYLALRGLWHSARWQARWMALLLAVSPAFLQQQVAYTYSAHFITYALFTFSLAAMIWAMRSPKRLRWLMPLSWLLALLHVMSMEYFIGLELLRPLILWWLAPLGDGKIRSRLWRVLRLWLPYGLVLVVFAIWRFVYFPQISYHAEANTPSIVLQMFKTPFTALISLVQIALRDFLHLIVFAWTNTFLPETIDLRAKSFLFAWGVGALLAVLLFWALHPRSETTGVETTGMVGTPSPDPFLRQAVLLGTLGILCGGLPIWLTDRSIIVGAWSDRFALAPMLGASILIVALVDWLGGGFNRKATLCVLAALAGLSAAYHIQLANKFRLHWEQQRTYYWQLSWRAPALQSGTAVIGPSIPMNYVAGYSLGLALNVIYAPEQRGDELSYWFINGLRELGSKRLPGNEQGLPIEDQFRNLTFKSSTSQSVVAAFNPARGCLRVLDEIYLLAPPIDNEGKLSALSNTAQILADNVHQPPSVLFGSEPPHDWCYYFEKADLARQLGDWREVIRLWDEAGNAGYAPPNGVELLPFVEAYGHLGNWPAAETFSRQALALTENLEPALCALWQRLESQSQPSPQQQEAIQRLQSVLQCRQGL
jgi:hypothetical protein